ncbi:hypothetical protein [Verminephrobacter aporrectodeae]|uniref:hypothetical protein n=1 Tax=Verminephrobacter aporrectodeae TaxID=1110389 RepID=UPI00191BCBFF
MEEAGNDNRRKTLALTLPSTGMNLKCPCMDTADSMLKPYRAPMTLTTGVVSAGAHVAIFGYSYSRQWFANTGSCCHARYKGRCGVESGAPAVPAPRFSLREWVLRYSFLTWHNIANLFRQTAIVAVGMTFVVLSLRTSICPWAA